MIEFHPDEKIVLERRKHWFPIAVEGVTLLGSGVAPTIIILAAIALPEEVRTFILSNQPLLWFLATGWFLLMWVIFFVVWTNYYLDVLIVTNKRVMDVEQRGLFARDVAELRVDNIQDVKVEIIGILASLLKFGNIHVQSAGYSREFVVRDIHDPNEVKHAISRQVDEAHGWKQQVGSGGAQNQGEPAQPAQ